MALTWGENGNWVKMAAQDDIVRGSQRIREIMWYATSATAGSHLMVLSELKNGAPVCAAVAEATQFNKVLPIASGPIEGLKLTDLDVGHIVVYFEERAGINPKKLHDETSEAAA